MPRFPVTNRSHYYAGDLVVDVPESEDYDWSIPKLEWESYSGGGAIIELGWEEVRELRDVLSSVLDLMPEWMRT